MNDDFNKVFRDMDKLMEAVQKTIDTADSIVEQKWNSIAKWEAHKITLPKKINKRWYWPTQTVYRKYVMSPGGQTTAHTHGHAVMAIAAYIQVPPKSGSLEALDPLEMMWRMYYRNHRPDTWDKIRIEQGDVIMFPGWIDHRTEVSQADPGLDRWVLTTNVFCHRMERAETAYTGQPTGGQRVEWGKK